MVYLKVKRRLSVLFVIIGYVVVAVIHAYNEVVRVRTFETCIFVRLMLFVVEKVIAVFNAR